MNIIFVKTGTESQNTYYKVLNLIKNSFNSVNIQVDTIYTDTVPSSDYNTLCICPPIKYQSIHNVKYCYSMHETAIIPKNLINGLNNKIETMIAPSKYVASIFSANGFQNSIYIANLYPDEIFKYVAPTDKKEFVVLCGGILINGAIRKSIPKIISGFQKAFRGYNDVKLIIKTLYDKLSYDTSDKRIININKNIPPASMLSLYAYSDCYVNLATGGFELMPLEALKVGRIVISHNYGGVSEYLNNSNHIPLEYKAKYIKEGIWEGAITEVSEDEIASKLHYAYIEKNKFKDMSLNISESVSMFNRENTAYQLLKAMSQHSSFKENNHPSVVLNSVNQLPEYTVLITTCNRTEKLNRALKSCVSHQIPNVAVTVSRASEKDISLIKSFKGKIPNLTYTYIKDDYGNNEAWLRGANIVNTDWTLLLHDDDYINSDHNVIMSYLNKAKGFLAWVPRVVGGGNHILKYFNQYGFLDTSEIYKILLNDEAYSISPGCGMFKTEDLINVLKECEVVLTNDERYYYRENMVVGNDLLIWLRMADKYKKFYYINQHITCFEHWDGSTTVEDTTKKQYKLAKIYNQTRNYYLFGDYKYKIIYAPNIYYIYNSDYPEIRKDVGECINYTKRLFKDKIITCGVETKECQYYTYSDGSKTPYIKSLIDKAIQKYNISESDYIIFANNDVYPVNSFYDYINFVFSYYGEAIPFYCFRRNVPNDGKRQDEISIRKSSIEFPGRDLFGMSVALWRKIEDEMLGFINGAEAWDMVLSYLLEFNGGIPLQYLIYHIDHPHNSLRKDKTINAKTNQIMHDFTRKYNVVVPSINPFNEEAYNITYPKRI